MVLNEACDRVEAIIRGIAPPNPPPPEEIQIEEIIEFGPDVLSPNQVRTICLGTEEVRIHGKTIEVQDVRRKDNGGYVITYTTASSGGYAGTLTPRVSG